MELAPSFPTIIDSSTIKRSTNKRTTIKNIIAQQSIEPKRRGTEIGSNVVQSPVQY